MKKTYMTPLVEAAELQSEIVMASMSDTKNGLGWGGSSDDAGITDADVNSDGGWDLWGN